MRCTIGKLKMPQTYTTLKRTTIKKQSGFHHNIRQSNAITERTFSVACHTIRDRHARKRAATIKRPTPDARHGAAAERGRDGDCAGRGGRNRRRTTVINMCLAVHDGIVPFDAVHDFRVGPNRQRDGKCHCADKKPSDDVAIHGFSFTHFRRFSNRAPLLFQTARSILPTFRYNGNLPFSIGTTLCQLRNISIIPQNRLCWGSEIL